MAKAMTAIRLRNRLGPPNALRALGLLDFAHAAALLTNPSPHPAGNRIDAAVPIDALRKECSRMPVS
jgi:hypothetical protein